MAVSTTRRSAPMETYADNQAPAYGARGGAK